MRVSAMSSALQSPRVKAILLVIGLCAVFLALRSQGVDYSRLSPEELKVTIDSYGIWGPLVYIVVYVARLFFLVPAGIAVAAARRDLGAVQRFCDRDDRGIDNGNNRVPGRAVFRPRRGGEIAVRPHDRTGQYAGIPGISCGVAGAPCPRCSV